ncbi:hypothetical protein GCM10027091_35600 [Streptomyces daliensis]
MAEALPRRHPVGTVGERGPDRRGRRRIRHRVGTGSGRLHARTRNRPRPLPRRGARQLGHRLADELDTAWRQWEAVGSPSLYDIGMTRTREEQYLWLGDTPGAHRWLAPAPQPTVSAGG